MFKHSRHHKQQTVHTQKTKTVVPHNHSPKKRTANLFYAEPNMGFTHGQLRKWTNEHNINIPVIRFKPDCDKCGGSGTYTKTISKDRLPCPKCYENQGYCNRCYGTGTHFTKGRDCRHCNTVKKLRQGEGMD